MRKISIILALSLALVFGLALQAAAFSVAYTNNAVYSVDSVAGNSVFETYSATQLIQFASHDGFAVVGNDPIYFDKGIVLTNPDNPANTQTTWHITNDTPYTWSDYHVILLPTIPDAVRFDDPNLNANDFKGADLVEDATGITEIDFYATAANQLVAPTETLNLTFPFVFTGADSFTYEFTMRQVATAVPVPPTALLMGSGLLGLGVLGWRRKFKS